MWKCSCGAKFDSIPELDLHKPSCTYKPKLYVQGIRDSSDINIDGDYYYSPATPGDVKREYERLFGDKP